MTNQQNEPESEDVSSVSFKRMRDKLARLEAATIKLGYASLVMILRRDAKKLVAKTKLKK